MDHNIVLCAGRDAPQAADRQELLTELLQGCGEFPLSRAQHGLNLGGMGYYLFLGELADPAPGGCRSGKRLPPPSEELLHGCAGIVGRYSGGEVFFLPPDQLCIILNDPDADRQAGRRSALEQMLRELTACTGSHLSCRYLSGRAEDFQGLREAYERYRADKPRFFFLRDLPVIRQEQAAGRQEPNLREVHAMTREIAEMIRLDPAAPELERRLHTLFFDLLKPGMSLPLYESSMAAIQSAVAEARYGWGGAVPADFLHSSIEEQYGLLLDRIHALQAAQGLPRQRKLAIVRKAVQYIEAHYDQDISVGDIAGALYLSAVYLGQVFKREMGIGVFQYVIRFRIEQAQKLLRETDDFIYAVSEKVGFHEFRHFSRTFKAMTGFHPTEYRAQFRSGGLSTPPCTSSEGRIVHRAV